MEMELRAFTTKAHLCRFSRFDGCSKPNDRWQMGETSEAHGRGRRVEVFFCIELDFSRL